MKLLSYKFHPEFLKKTGLRARIIYVYLYRCISLSPKYISVYRCIRTTYKYTCVCVTTSLSAGSDSVILASSCLQDVILDLYVPLFL